MGECVRVCEFGKFERFCCNRRETRWVRFLSWVVQVGLGNAMQHRARQFVSAALFFILVLVAHVPSIPSLRRW